MVAIMDVHYWDGYIARNTNLPLGCTRLQATNVLFLGFYGKRLIQ